MKEFPHVKRGDRLELEITGSAFEGKSIARFHGIVVFVEGGVPGDLVTAEVTKAKKNLVEAQLLELKKPSAFRVDPRCIHFGVCGGCKWQHVKYQAQLQFKQQHVVDSFERIGGFPDVSVQPIIGADDIFFYRNKMEFSFSDQEWFETPPAEAMPKGIFLGLHVPKRFDKILDLKECHLQSDLSNEILALTRAFARENNAPVYATETDSGYLRFLVIRQSKRTKELMV
ncbi:MAG TPA: TRAM domain-containing protein, partial [Terriglobia bacterium]|nr:TRAM domain-containing protein [Terriglobia bacterium]